jgi:hypothetical protein
MDLIAGRQLDNPLPGDRIGLQDRGIENFWCSP